MALGPRILAEALALVDTPFRHGGHDPASGLDCVGLVAAAHRRAGVAVGLLPDRYRWREATVEQLRAALRRAGLRPVDEARLGDVLVQAMPGGQLHLLIAGDGLVVHAHAGLRRVVAMPGDGPGVLQNRWCVGVDRLMSPDGDTAHPRPLP